MPIVRLWAVVSVARAADAQAALDASGLPGMASSFQGRFPLGSPVVHYAGWQGEAAFLNQIRLALQPVPQLRMALGAVYGPETDASPGVVQEADVNDGTPPNATDKYSRRALLKKAYLLLGQGTPPADVTAPSAQRTQRT